MKNLVEETKEFCQEFANDSSWITITVEITYCIFGYCTRFNKIKDNDKATTTFLIENMKYQFCCRIKIKQLIAIDWWKIPM